MTELPDHPIRSTLRSLTGIEPPPAAALAGRNVWGRVAFGRDGWLHVEVLAKDEVTNAAAMKSIGATEMQAGSDARYRLYRQRRIAAAADINRAAVETHRLFLMVSANGQLTKVAKVIALNLL